MGTPYDSSGVRTSPGVLTGFVVDNTAYFATRSQTPISSTLTIAYCTRSSRRLLLANRLPLRTATAFLARIPYL